MRTSGIEDASAGEMERFHRRTRELFENLNQDLLNLELSFEQQADFTYLMDAMAANLRALRGIAEGQQWTSMLAVINEFLELVSAVQDEHIQMREDTLDTLFDGYDTLQMLHNCRAKGTETDQSMLDGWQEKYGQAMATAKPPEVSPYEMEDELIIEDDPPMEGIELVENALPPIED